MFGTITGTYPYPPYSKPWAIVQGFWSKSAQFRPFGIHPKSSPTVQKVVGNPFASTLKVFQGVWNDYRHLPISAIFKTMGYSPGFLVKIGRFRTQFTPNLNQQCRKYLETHLQAKVVFEAVWNDSQQVFCSKSKEKKSIV